MTVVHSWDKERPEMKKQVVHARQGQVALTGYVHSSQVEEQGRWDQTSSSCPPNS